MSDPYSKHAIIDRVNFHKGEGSLIFVRLSLACGASSDIYLHGANVVSFKLETGEDVFFVSSKAIFNEAKAIRGGIPVIFPQFGPGKLPQHGFARNSNDWTVVSTSAAQNEAIITLQLVDTLESRKQWDHSFLATVTVKLTYNEIDKAKLYQSFSVKNTDSAQEFEFTTALHTYFTVPDIHKTSLTPFLGLTYNDKPTGTVKEQKENAIHITGETDRVYQNAPNELYIHTPTHTTTIKKTGFTDAVVWNAWEQLSKTIADLGPDDWKGYVCCEVGNVATPVKLKAGASWEGTHIISRKPTVHANV